MLAWTFGSRLRGRCRLHRTGERIDCDQTAPCRTPLTVLPKARCKRSLIVPYHMRNVSAHEKAAHPPHTARGHWRDSIVRRRRWPTKQYVFLSLPSKAQASGVHWGAITAGGRCAPGRTSLLSYDMTTNT